MNESEAGLPSVDRRDFMKATAFTAGGALLVENTVFQEGWGSKLTQRPGRFHLSGITFVMSFFALANRYDSWQ